MSGSSKQTQKNEVSIPEEYKPYFNSVLGSAQSLFNDGGFANIVGMSDATRSGLDSNLGLADYLEGTLLPQVNSSYASLLNSDLVNSPELQSVIQSAVRPVQQQLERYTLPTTQDAATMAGQGGSSRQGIAEGLARSEANTTMADVGSNLSYNALLQDQQNKQFAQSNLQNLIASLQTPANLRTGVGGIEEGYEQEAANSEMENLMRYAQIVAMFNPGSNTTSTGTSNQSTFSKLAALGSLGIKGYTAFTGG